MQWAEGQTLTLQILDGPDRGRYVTRLDEVRATEVLLVWPTRRRVLVRLKDGDAVLCRWHGPEGTFVVRTRVCRLQKGAVPMVAVDRVGDVARVQRRAHVRVAVRIPVKFAVLAASAQPAVAAAEPVEETATRDLSGGGLLVATRRQLAPGARLDLTLDVAGQAVQVLGEVVRVTPVEGADRMWVGIRFVSIAERERDAIVRFIFNQQRLLRRKGLA